MGHRVAIINASGYGQEMCAILLGSHLLLQGRVIEASFGGYLENRSLILTSPIGSKVIGDPETFSGPSDILLLCAIGNTKMRKTYVESKILKTYDYVTALSKKAAIAKQNVVIGNGSVIAPFSAISVNVLIGHHSFIMAHAVVGHDVQIGSYCHIGSHSFIGGSVQVADMVTIGPSASIAKNVKIGEGAVVGMGSVVLRDVPPYAVVFGNPAKVVKEAT